MHVYAFVLAEFLCVLFYRIAGKSMQNEVKNQDKCLFLLFSILQNTLT